MLRYSKYSFVIWPVGGFEEGRKVFQPKCCVYKNEEENNCPKILSDNNQSSLFK